MLDVNLIFKIAALGVLLIVIDKILSNSGKGEFAFVTNLAGLIIIFMLVINLISNLFNAMRTMFQF